MKKYLVYTLILIPVTLLAQNGLVPVSCTVKRGEKIGNCTGNKGNICEFDKTEELSNIALIKISDQQLKMTIDCRNFTEEEKATWIGKESQAVSDQEPTYFTQQFSIGLQPQLSAELQLNPHYTKIPPGEYLISVEEHSVSIVFNLVTN